MGKNKQRKNLHRAHFPTIESKRSIKSANETSENISLKRLSIVYTANHRLSGILYLLTASYVPYFPVYHDLLGSI